MPGLGRSKLRGAVARHTRPAIIAPLGSPVRLFSIQPQRPRPAPRYIQVDVIAGLSQRAVSCESPMPLPCAAEGKLELVASSPPVSHELLAPRWRRLKGVILVICIPAIERAGHVRRPVRSLAADRARIGDM